MTIAQNNLDTDQCYLHERPASQNLTAARSGSTKAATLCLVTSLHAPAARLHPYAPSKPRWGLEAQTPVCSRG